MEAKVYSEETAEYRANSRALVETQVQCLLRANPERFRVYEDFDSDSAFDCATALQFLMAPCNVVLDTMAPADFISIIAECGYKFNCADYGETVRRAYLLCKNEIPDLSDEKSRERIEAEQKIVVYIPGDLLELNSSFCETLSEETVNNGVFHIRHRSVFLLDDAVTKVGFAKWLQSAASDCIVCYERCGTSLSPDTAKAINCPKCGELVCVSCVVDLSMATRTLIEDGFAAVKCPNCREKHWIQLWKLCCRVLYRKDSCGIPFSRKKMAFLTKWSRKVPRSLRRSCTDSFRPVELERKSRRGKCCAKCGKEFWDKKEAERALRCKDCKRMRYCSGKCRRAHQKHHLCEAQTPGAKKKKKKASAAAADDNDSCKPY